MKRSDAHETALHRPRRLQIPPGYFKNQATTDAAFFEADGQRWYRTGDIGGRTGGGGTPGVVVIDRVQNLFKLAQGEFIAPERLEQIFSASPRLGPRGTHGRVSPGRGCAPRSGPAESGGRGAG